MSAKNIEHHIIRIDKRISKIIKDIPYLLIFTEKNVYRIYFVNLNFFKSYKNGEEYKSLFFEIFDLTPNGGKLFLGVGNYKHISHMIPTLLTEKTGEKIVTYSLRMNARPFKAFDTSPVIDYYCFEHEKICLVYSDNLKKKRILEKILKEYTFCEI